MRISTQMLYDQNMRGVNDAQRLWLSYGQQMSTGLRVNKPSEDPVASAQAVVLSQAQAENSQFKLARVFASQKVSQEESILQQVTSSITSAKERIVNAGNSDALTDEARAALSTDLNGIRNQLLNFANSTDGNGRYVFAGYKTEAAPFSGEEGNVTYKGGTIPISQQVDSARTMIIGHTGDQVFNHISSNPLPEPDGSPSETNLFAMLDSAINALKTPTAGLDDEGKKALSDAVAKTSRGLDNALSNVSTVRAELGIQLNELSKLDALSNVRAIGQTDEMSQLVGADWAASASSYVQQQAALQAAYKTFSDMQGMSLFQINTR